MGFPSRWGVTGIVKMDKIYSLFTPIQSKKIHVTLLSYI